MIKSKIFLHLLHAHHIQAKEKVPTFTVKSWMLFSVAALAETNPPVLNLLDPKPPEFSEEDLRTENRELGNPVANLPDRWKQPI